MNELTIYALADRLEKSYERIKELEDKVSRLEMVCSRLIADVQTHPEPETTAEEGSDILVRMLAKTYLVP